MYTPHFLNVLLLFQLTIFYLLNNFLKLLTVQLSGTDLYFLVSCSYEILLHYFNKFNSVLISLSNTSCYGVTSVVEWWFLLICSRTIFNLSAYVSACKWSLIVTYFFHQFGTDTFDIVTYHLEYPCVKLLGNHWASVLIALAWLNNCPRLFGCTVDPSYPTLTGPGRGWIIREAKHPFTNRTSILVEKHGYETNIANK